MALKTRSKLSFNSGPLSQPTSVESRPSTDELVVAPKGRRERKSEIPASRRGLVPFGFFVPPEARRQIKGFAGLNGRTTQDIGQEMLDDWFVKHGMHRLAGTSDTST